MLQGSGHPCTANAEHEGKKLMGEKEFIIGNAVLRHEQPAGKPLLNFAVGIGQGGIARLHSEHVGKA
jgi:hypothetical protein